jgi:tetratricopeptide (TPR) repeat protein
MSSYPGNSSLATAVKDRVVSTYEQTLALHRQGRTDEVVAGCNLILQMDPLFDPARKLLDQARHPAPAGDPMAEAQQAMAARDYERVVAITTDILTNDLMNEDARLLSDQAREKMEAAPFVEQFVRKCKQHIDSGNIAAARGDLEKARALDSGHPGIAQMEAMINKGEAATPGAFDASSFVVETPSAAPRGAAQASDFGFTFEEEKNAASSGFDSFSFDTPAATTPAFSPTPAPPPAPPAPPSPPKEGAAEFDFSTASIEPSPDDQKKIEQYLSDGDAAFAAADYQKAIDLWSRIFLIDVTNDAASERIEKAKLKRREIESRLESVLAAGVAAFEKRDFATARMRLQEVLQADPNHAQAQEYLDRIQSEGQGVPVYVPPTSSFPEEIDTTPTSFDEPPDLVAAPIPSPKKPAKAAKPAPAATKSKTPMLAVMAVLAVIVLGAGGWFFLSGGDDASSTTEVNSAAVVNRASGLGQDGRFDEAIAALREIQPGDPQYDTAIAMIADLQQKQRRASTSVDGRPAAQVYDERVAAGREAFAARDYFAAKRAFDEAIRVKPLPPDLQAAYQTASLEVAKLDTARTLFEERKYAEAISNLSTLRAREPQNQTVRRMLIDAHFNRGAVALQQDRLSEAIRAFDEVLTENPDDELARRSRELAQRYDGQPKDLLYRIYVKYLPLRQAAG